METLTFDVMNALMSGISKFAVLLFFILSVGSACKSKKKAVLSSDEPVEVSEFMEFFQQVNLPYVYSDTQLLKKETDSLLISHANFVRFIPDTLLTGMYDKTVPKIYAVGKATVEKGETYLFIKTAAADKNALLILAFNRSYDYLGGITVLKTDKNKTTNEFVTMDRRHTITRSTQIKNADGTMSEGKDVYVLNADAKMFTLIMTESLNDKVELINPIDTLAKKGKWAGDYVQGKTNLVSIRDGKRTDIVNFFIHFEKNDGACTGEIKGEARLLTANTAEYREEGDPCILKFVFTSTSVMLQEVEGCGSKRPLNCTLNGNFNKKKPATTAVAQ